MAGILRTPLVLAVFAALLVTACGTPQAPSSATSSSSAAPARLSTGQLKFVWKDVSYKAHPHRVLVMANTRESRHRRALEDEFVSQLRAFGADAVASHKVLPDEKMDDQAAVAAMAIEQVPDTILLTSLVGKKNLKVYAPGAASYRPTYYGKWRDYYRYGYETSSTRAYPGKSGNMMMECNLYDTLSEDLIWAAAYEGENISTDADRIKAYVTLVVKNMVDQGFFRE